MKHIDVIHKGIRGFTLVELLVVISLISLLMAVSLPALNHIRLQARSIVSMNNQRQITSSINMFSSDNDQTYPPSVATIGTDDNWNWTDPTRLTGNKNRTPVIHRAMSEYLRSYISNASIMFCPNAPKKYKYMQQAWDAGDDWDNPDTSVTSDPVGGTYCFYWNYIGCLDGGSIFRGPQNPASGGRSFSKLLTSDYFGYDHWRNPGSFGSCERFNNADVTAETWLLAAYWSSRRAVDNPPEIKARAGYTDGHVETYSTSAAVPMKVSITSDGRTPYPDGVGPGTFYLPINAIR
jgi:prepilin-type N-terminal cleavage/methylation domain-containing protein